MTNLTMVRLIASLIVAMVFALPAHAHLTPNSEIRLRLEPGVVHADVLIPLAEFAYSNPKLPPSPIILERYLLRHTQARAPDGRAWTVAVRDTRVVPAPGGPDILATLTYRPPNGAPDRKFTLFWDAIIREADSHFALVSIQGDVVRGMSGSNDLVGSITAGQASLRVDFGKPGRGALFLGTAKLGARHILQGYDHLMFLLALLLPAPLLPVRGRWRNPRSRSATVRGLASIVTAFTIGHSLTLFMATAFDARLPVVAVEAAIALSVLVSALHALKPIFPGRETWVAFGFGLIHGLAFATAISDFHVMPSVRAMAILGFNVGIELVQIALVLAVLPGLLVAAQAKRYALLRQSLGAFAMIAAVSWLFNRVTGLGNGMATGFANVLPLLGALLIVSSAVCGIASIALHLRRRLSAGTSD